MSALHPSESGTPDEERAGLLARVVAWLRAGYPTGVPERDHVPLLALLRRRLGEDEVAEVSRQLLGSADGVDIGVGITKITGEVPSPADVERVRVHLAASNDPLG